MKALAQAGLNRACVDCGDLPFAGGMRCLPCFQHRVDTRLSEGHGCLEHGPSMVCYVSCRCRCAACRKESARVKRESRQATKGAA